MLEGRCACSEISWLLWGKVGCCRPGLDSGDGIFVASWDSTSVEQSLVGTMKPGLFKNCYGVGQGLAEYPRP